MSRETIVAAGSGDRPALELIFRAYHPALVRFLRVRALEMADDVASQTWVSVTESISGFEGDGDALRRWIITIGRRRLADELRRRGRRPEVPSDAMEAMETVDALTPEELISSEVDWARRLLSQLPSQQADVILMRVIGGLSVEEVAAETGLTRANVRVISHRGLARLRELVAAETVTPAIESGLAVTGSSSRTIYPT